MKVLYEDNHLLVVEKPVNVPVQADASGDKDLLTLCKQYIKEKYGKPGEVYLGLVHRLDRPVGGVMVFARTSKAAARLTEQFKSNRAKKRYAAIAEGEAPAEAQLTDTLYKDESTNTVTVVPEGTKGGKLAKLSYRTLAREKGLSLLDISLLTGRPHQIRVQLSHSGFPLKGDQKYNRGAVLGEQIRLWAYALTLQHPTLGEEMTFYSLPPFKEFPAAVKYLPAFTVCSGVYEDSELLVVDKNRGVEVEEELLIELSTLMEPLYAVHRLDANTEGLVVFARNLEAKHKLEEAFLHRETGKLYEAVLLGALPKKEDRLLQYALKDEEQGKMRLASPDTPGALKMELGYRVLEERGGLTLAEIRLYTGRTHQIRLQMASLGCPVLGDDKYGSFEGNRRYKQRRQALLAKELQILGHTFTSTRQLSLDMFL